MLVSENKYGFIVVDGSGALYATVQGNTTNVLYRLSVQLPRKHGRGGQSALRFARLRLSARHNYLTKISELATKFFIDSETNKTNVGGLVLAGSADFKVCV
jgi:peptide chain release factor subunit 1